MLILEVGLGWPNFRLLAISGCDPLEKHGRNEPSVQEKKHLAGK